jgi:hypothetical protein
VSTLPSVTLTAELFEFMGTEQMLDAMGDTADDLRFALGQAADYGQFKTVKMGDGLRSAVVQAATSLNSPDGEQLVEVPTRQP